jgi:hypothetical protein
MREADELEEMKLIVAALKEDLRDLEEDVWALQKTIRGLESRLDSQG